MVVAGSGDSTPGGLGDSWWWGGLKQFGNAVGDGFNAFCDVAHDFLDSWFFGTEINQDHPKIREVESNRQFLKEELNIESVRDFGNAEEYGDYLAGILPFSGAVMALEGLTNTENSTWDRALDGVSLVFSAVVVGGGIVDDAMDGARAAGKADGASDAIKHLKQKKAADEIASAKKAVQNNNPDLHHSRPNRNYNDENIPGRGKKWKKEKGDWDEGDWDKPKIDGDYLDARQKAMDEYRNNVEFRRWFHREHKPDSTSSGGGGGRTNPDMSPDDIKRAFDEWVSRGNPEIK